jgi:GH15 family glucan-1,4-alpha-glucosidase
MQTAALVATNGGIDWVCFPQFDSPSVFAALFNDRTSGSFVSTPESKEQTAASIGSTEWNPRRSDALERATES